MKHLVILLLLVFTAQAQAKNVLCQKAFIERFLVEDKDLCELTELETPIKAQNLLKQIENANRKIIQSLNLPKENPFLEGLTIVLKVSDHSVMGSAYEFVDGHPTVNLGTTANNFYGSFSNFIYTHEMGHWYISQYLKQAEGKDGLKNIATFQEFFADALALDIYGDFVTSDIDAPQCIRQIRSLGPDNTYHKGIGEFDYASYFRNSENCCRDLVASGKETELSKTVCKENKEIEEMWFPKGLPPYSKAPLMYNIHSFGLSVKSENVSRLEPHRTSAPMNSFLKEFSQLTKNSVMKLVLPALKKVTDDQVTQECAYEDVLKQGISDFKKSINVSRLDELFLEMRKQLKTPEEIALFDQLYKKYSMKTAQAIFKNELMDIAKYLIQTELSTQLTQAWKNGNSFLTQWHCIDQKTGEFSNDCSFDVTCESSVPEKREFLRRDKNKSVYTPVVKFINEENQKEVIFVGMNHTGPRHYFESVEKYLKKHLVSEKTLTLREFYTCSGKPVLYSNATNITKDEGDSLNTYLTNLYYPDAFFKLDRTGLAPLIKTYQMKEDQCVLDVDQKTIRPRIIVERNVNGCSKAHANSMECQWETVEKLLSSSANTGESDLDLSEESLAVQIASINMYQGLPTGGNFELWGRLFFPSQYVLDGYREASLLKKTLESLGSKKRVVLPWGVGHVQAVKELLYQNGFKQYAVTEIPFAHMSDYGTDEGINSMLTEDFDYIGEEYNF